MLLGEDEIIPKTLEEWILDEKRFEERIRYQERIQYHCTIIGTRGFEIKCREDCSQCSYYWFKNPNKVSIEQLNEDGIQLASKEESPVEYAERKEKEEIVNTAIASLPSEDLKVVACMISNSYSFASGPGSQSTKEMTKRLFKDNPFKSSNILKKAVNNFFEKKISLKGVQGTINLVLKNSTTSFAKALKKAAMKNTLMGSLKGAIITFFSEMVLLIV